MNLNIKKYIPDQGDIVWIDLEPTLGHEQKGYRPALVLTKLSLNQRNYMCIICPITSKDKKFPFDIKLKNNKTKGFIMSDHIKSIDWRNRKIRFIEKINEEIYQEVISKINILIEA